MIRSVQTTHLSKLLNDSLKLIIAELIVTSFYVFSSMTSSLWFLTNPKYKILQTYLCRDL